MRIRTLHDLGKAIAALDNGYRVTVRNSWSTTDTPVPRSRLRNVGKGRNGLRIKVEDPQGRLVLDHDTSECYRTVREAVAKAIKLFGDEFDPDPELIPVDTQVRVFGFYRKAHGIVKSVKMHSKTRAESYQVHIYDGNSEMPFTCKPYDLVPV